MQLKFEIIYSLRRLEQLIDSKILWSSNKEIYRISVYMEVLIHLKDLLQKADKLGLRIKFTDDIVQKSKPKIEDITDLISHFRDAVCHIDTFRKYADQTAISFLELRGKSKYEHSPQIESKYDDDIAFIMGDTILYLKRHVERVHNELKQTLSEYLGTKFINFAIQENGG